MKFSLVNIVAETKTDITGVWVQNHVGTLKSATERACAIEHANNYRVKIAVVEDLNYSEPNYSYRTGLKRLDRQY